jgi:hypothetical protein
MDVGLRISLDAPKQQSNLPHGYTPVKGPTEEEKTVFNNRNNRHSNYCCYCTGLSFNMNFSVI